MVVRIFEGTGSNVKGQATLLVQCTQLAFFYLNGKMTTAREINGNGYIRYGEAIEPLSKLRQRRNRP